MKHQSQLVNVTPHLMKAQKSDSSNPFFRLQKLNLLMSAGAGVENCLLTVIRREKKKGLLQKVSYIQRYPKLWITINIVAQHLILTIATEL